MTVGHHVRPIEPPRPEPRSAVREYLYTDQLAELTPWSPDAIRTMVARGIFKPNVHFFRPHGLGSRPIFKWSAVVDYIEGRAASDQQAVQRMVSLADGREIDLDEAAKEAKRLLG